MWYCMMVASWQLWRDRRGHLSALRVVTLAFLLMPLVKVVLLKMPTDSLPAFDPPAVLLRHAAPSNSGNTTGTSRVDHPDGSAFALPFR
jgi:hypothetical protein